MTKGKNKAYARRVLRKKLNRNLNGGLSKMMGRYCRYNWGAGL